MAGSMRVRIVTGTLAMGIAATLTGCFGNPVDALVDRAAQDGAEQVAEDLIEGMSDGEASVDFGSLPDGFPSEITLVSDNIIQSMTIDEGMVVIVTDPRGMDELVAQVESDFSGWEQEATADMGEMLNVTYRKDESLSVNVSIIAPSGEEEATVGYTVIPAQ
ncbi:hypothetical protein WDU99_15450 [Microbacterium sp. Mu-80]|uniref:Uncharacterized protein n=1 Tax=Microbacterium bandirmense TaxID=3122050 RepID=A0ABU8LFE4_9MICO